MGVQNGSIFHTFLKMCVEWSILSRNAKKFFAPDPSVEPLPNLTSLILIKENEVTNALRWLRIDCRRNSYLRNF